MFVIDKKYTGFLTAMTIIYFVVIILYSIMPELTAVISSKIWDVIYWINNTLFIVFLTFTGALLSCDEKLRILLFNTSLFLLILGVFQIANTLISINTCVWIIISSTCILTSLIIYKYVSSKLYEK